MSDNRFEDNKMSDWVAVPVEFEGELRSEIWHELWGFNNYNPPKFWFGDRVRTKAGTGTVLGLDWKTKNMLTDPGREPQWCYQVNLDGRCSLMGFYEQSLEAIED